MLGIKEDTSLTDIQFGWLGLIFFIGYLIFQLLTDSYQIMKQVHINNVCLTSLINTGINSISYLKVFSRKLPWCDNDVSGRCLRSNSHFQEIYTFDGVPLFIAAILISCLYRRREQFTCITAFYIVSSLSMSPGGILSYGIGHMDGICGLSAWKW